MEGREGFIIVYEPMGTYWIGKKYQGQTITLVGYLDDLMFDCLIESKVNTRLEFEGIEGFLVVYEKKYTYFVGMYYDKKWKIKLVTYYDDIVGDILDLE